MFSESISPPLTNTIFASVDALSFTEQTHPQLTLRTRSKLIPLHNQPSLRTRFTSLTCLVCQLVVYRVHQTVSPDFEGKDGPVLPTNDWVETEVLMSCSGWIGVHNSCLVSISFTRRSRKPSVAPSAAGALRGGQLNALGVDAMCGGDDCCLMLY
jgi:hypothetical protein